MTCERCGMYIYDGPILTHGQMLGREAITGDEPLAKDEHSCPEPYDLDTARVVLQSHAATKIPMHPRTYARCVLALRLSEEAPET